MPSRKHLLSLLRPVAALGLALLLAACGGGERAGPSLGDLGEAETVPVRLGVETRPALAAAEDGRGRVELRLAGRDLILAFGWRAPEGETPVATVGVRALFRDSGGTLHPLAEAALPPSPGAAEGWLEIRVPVPESLAGRPGTLEIEHGRAGDWELFTAVPRLVPERGERPNLILVSIDTLRQDRLGAYGYARPTSPTVDAMAEQGTLFRNALAQASWTLPSHYTMLTSLYPSAHGVNPDRWLFAGVRGSSEKFQIRGSGREKTLAERLTSLGYFTAAITEGGWVDARFGFDQGFASYVGHNNDRLEEGSERLALGWLREHGDLPFFLFLHTYQVHQPYHQPPPYDRTFVDPEHIGYAMPGLRLPMEVYDQFKDGTFPPMPGDVEAFGGLYDGEVRYVDSFLEAVLEELRRQGRDADTIVLFTSDHGEELFEHGNFDHGETLYDEVMRVPLVLWGPGRIPAGKVVDAPVALLDVLPTLVELGGGESNGPVQGRSLVPLLAGDGHEAFTGRRLFAEGFADESVPLACVWDGPYKVIFDGAELEGAELFDLLQDPGERENLAAADPSRVERLRDVVRAWQAENARIREALGAAATSLDAATQERLRALGYL